MRVRTKAAYLAFDASAELEFEFFLATKLGKTVGQLRREMTQDEFVRWDIYYAREAQRLELERAQRS